MKTNENDRRKPNGLWNRLSSFFIRRPAIDETILEEVRAELAKPLPCTLERIREHLRQHGLGQKVEVGCETDGEGFVLEDGDGLVHAKDYAAAVAIIERIWLYQPGAA